MFKYRCRNCDEMVDLKHDCSDKTTGNKSDLSAVLDGLVDKWGREMLRLQAASRNAQTSLEATAYDAVSVKIADFLDDLDTLVAD